MTRKPEIFFSISLKSLITVASVNVKVFSELFVAAAAEPGRRDGCSSREEEQRALVSGLNAILSAGHVPVAPRTAAGLPLPTDQAQEESDEKEEHAA